MSRRQICWLSAFGLLALLILLAGWWFLNSQFVDIDGCLDSGGRWGEYGSCEFVQTGR